MTSLAESLRLKVEAISEAPRSRNASRKAMSSITKVLNLASHATIIAVKPWPPEVEVRDGVAGAGHGDVACQAADGTGDGHGADEHPAGLDAGVASGSLALAENRNLIALLGEAQVQIHADGKDHYQEHIEADIQPEELREPAGLGLLVDDAHGVGAEGILPQRHAVGRDLNGHIVHSSG